MKHSVALLERWNMINVLHDGVVLSILFPKRKAVDHIPILL